MNSNIFEFLKILILLDLNHFYFLANDYSLIISYKFMNISRDSPNIALEGIVSQFFI